MSSKKLPMHLEMAEASLPLAYSAQFEWGGIHITQVAQDEMQLEPRIPVLEGGKIEDGPREDGHPNVNVFITSPDELSTPSSISTSELMPQDPYSRSVAYRYGLGVAIAPKLNLMGLSFLAERTLRTKISEQSDHKGAYRNFGVVPPELIEERLREEMPVLIPKIMASSLAGRIEGTVKKELDAYYRDRKTYEIAHMIQSRLVTTLGIITGFTLSKFALYGDVDVNGYVAAMGGILSIKTGLDIPFMKRAIQDLRNAQNAIPLLAEDRGISASSSIGELYDTVSLGNRDAPK